MVVLNLDHLNAVNQLPLLWNLTVRSIVRQPAIVMRF